MRCDICNSIIPKPVWNERLGAFDPCHVCLDEVAEAVKPDEEDDLYDESWGEDLSALDDWDL